MGQELSLESSAVVADDVVIRRSRGVFAVTIGQRSIDSGPDLLPILAAFSSSRSLKSGMDILTKDAQTPGRVAAVMGQIRALIQEGILTAPTGTAAALGQNPRRFDSAPVHIRMLNDRRRTSAFQEALRRAVGPDDVVVDIGTSTGVLAMTAAHAGARHVYAIERTAIAEAAQVMFRNDAVANDRVTLIRGQSTEIRLPEQAQILVSEIIGDDPLGEHILETFWDARRLLVDEPRLIPKGLIVYGLALEVPSEVLRFHRFDSATADTWSETYGLDFSPLVRLAGEQDHRVDLNSFHTRTWPRISKELVLSEIDFASAGPAIDPAQVTFRAERSGTISGLLLYFDADLGNDIRLSLHPDAADATNSWANRIHLFSTPLSVSVGDLLQVDYAYRAGRSHVSISRLADEAKQP